MNLIDLFLLVYFVGGGAVAGWRLGGVPGGAVGGATGWCLLSLVSRLASHESSKMPSCECGAPWGALVFEKHSSFEYVYRCGDCHRAYIIRAGKRWDRVTENNECVPISRRNFWGNWHSG